MITFISRLFILRERILGTHWIGRVVSRGGLDGEGKRNLLSQPGIEIRFLGIAARRLIAMPTDISCTINKIVQQAAIYIPTNKIVSAKKIIPT
jgi:hypothetical protein